MMTANTTMEMPVATATLVSQIESQNETPVSDLDIIDRVDAIRRTWTPTERLNRRREADQRFADLLSALSMPQKAA